MKNRRFFGANFWGGEMVGANFYAFCNYDCQINFNLNQFVREGTEIVRFDGNLQGSGIFGSKSDPCIALSVSQSVALLRLD